MSAILDTADLVVNGVLNKIILWALAISGALVVLETVGFLPARILKRINKNRLHETTRLLTDLGVDIPEVRRDNLVARLEKVSRLALKARTAKRLDGVKIKQPVMVGSVVNVAGNHYIDLMGATAEEAVAELFARDLIAYWRILLDERVIAHTKVDFIVTPKTGSPILGAKVAKLLNLPLLLHNPETKFQSKPLSPRAVFDCRELPEEGARALVVDDSSTGGGKAEKLIKALRDNNYVVSDFLVVFEPMLKESTGQNAAKRLEPLRVALHSIVRT